jgi:hypothetical protein
MPRGTPSIVFCNTAVAAQAVALYETGHVSQAEIGRHGKGSVMVCHACGSHDVGPEPIGVTED